MSLGKSWKLCVGRVTRDSLKCFFDERPDDDMADESFGQDQPVSHAPAAAQETGAGSHLAFHVYVSLLWFAFSAQWTTLLSVIIPDQVANIVGPEAANKEGLSGSVLGAGAIVALFVAPLAGALSDRARSASGRRRPFLISGVLGSCVGLMILAPFGRGSSLILYTLAFLNLTFWWNWMAGAYAGLIPDVVPDRDQNLASAWINIMTAIGTGLGNFLVAVLYTPDHPMTVFAAFVALSLACLGLTLKHVKEPPAAGADDTFAIRRFLRSFVISPRAHPNFYWVLVTRFFVNMGVWSISALLLFYTQDVIGLAQAANVLPALNAAGAILSIPASLCAVWLSARYGLVPIVQAASWIMAFATICYVLIPLQPHFVSFAATVLVFSLAWGAYQAVDWALALKVLPSAAGAGKDMGIWHIAFVLPLVIGPVFTGWLVSYLKLVVSTGVAYMGAFAIAALWFALAAALVVRLRLRRPP